MQLTPKIEYKQIERESWKLSFTGQNGTSSKIARGDELSRLPGTIQTWVCFVPELSRAFFNRDDSDLGLFFPRVFAGVFETGFKTARSLDNWKVSIIKIIFCRLWERVLRFGFAC